MTAHEMLAQVRQLPPISPAALKLASLLGDPRINNEDMVTIVNEDPVLTAKLLRACNSPATGLREAVASVNQAILLLGHDRISQMVTALAFRGTFNTALPGYALAADDLWRHSLLTATAAQALARVGVEFGLDESVAYTVGLLHDIGKLITNEFLTRQSALAIRSRVAEGRSPFEAEREVLGTDHAEVGASLLFMWRLPELIVEAVALHHRPIPGRGSRLAEVVHSADLIAHRAAEIRSGREISSRTELESLDRVGFGLEQVLTVVTYVSELAPAGEELIAMPA